MRTNVTLWCIIVSLIFSLCITVNSCINTKRDYENTDRSVKSDTIILTKVDTIRLTEIRYKYVKTIDTIAIQCYDTITNTVYIPIEQKYYKEPQFEAWVSGYKVALDSINVYAKTEYKTITNTITIKPKRKIFGVGVHVGYGVNLQGQFSPYIGVGISCNLINF